MSAAEAINGRFEDDGDLTDAEIVQLRAEVDARASKAVAGLRCLTNGEKLRVLA